MEITAGMLEEGDTVLYDVAGNNRDRPTIDRLGRDTDGSVLIWFEGQEDDEPVVYDVSAIVVIER